MSQRTRFCAVCNQEIDPARVEALPDTILCTKHGEAVKKYGGEFQVTATTARLGKEGSLKKNYGDVSTTKRRNWAAIERLKVDHELEGHQGDS
jgi:Prokaryotic dksA/traR C4-type zinc finger